MVGWIWVGVGLGCGGVDLGGGGVRLWWGGVDLGGAGGRSRVPEANVRQQNKSGTCFG